MRAFGDASLTVGSNLGKLKHHLTMILANLYVGHCHEPGRYIAYSRSSNDYTRRYTAPGIGYRPMIKAVRGLEELGHIEAIPGENRGPAGSGFVSRMRATDRLLALLEAHGVAPGMDSRVEHEPETIILRNSQGRATDYPDTPETRRMRDVLRRYNSQLEETPITLAEGAPNQGGNLSRKRVHRVFNNGSFEQGGRFYGPWWQGHKELRPFILINGNPTVEYDYSAEFVHLLYSEEGVNYHDVFGEDDDPYRAHGLEAFPRNVMKDAFFRILNTTSRARAVRSIETIGLVESEATRDLEIVAEDLIDSFASKHKAISQYFFTEPAVNAGVKVHHWPA